MPETDVVHIIDDDQDVLRALAFFLSTRGIAVQAHESAARFLERLPGLSAACVISDLRMPVIDGLELQRRLRALNFRSPLIIMTAHADITLAVEAMKGGALDFIEKPIDYDVLLSAIRTALARGRGENAANERSAEVRARVDLLSERERQVLEGVVAGKSNKVIARDLGLSSRTVEAHRANVMGKMQADSLSALVRLVLVSGLSP